MGFLTETMTNATSKLNRKFFLTDLLLWTVCYAVLFSFLVAVPGPPVRGIASVLALTTSQIVGLLFFGREPDGLIRWAIFASLFAFAVLFSVFTFALVPQSPVQTVTANTVTGFKSQLAVGLTNALSVLFVHVLAFSFASFAGWVLAIFSSTIGLRRTFLLVVNLPGSILTIAFFLSYIARICYSR